VKAAAAVVFGLLLLGALVALPSARADSGWGMQFYLLPQYGAPIFLSDNVSANSTILVNVTFPSSSINTGPRQLQIFDDTALQLKSISIGTLNNTTVGSHRTVTVNLRQWVYSREVVFTFRIFDQTRGVYELSVSLLVHMDIGLVLQQERTSLEQEIQQRDAATRQALYQQLEDLKQVIAQQATELVVAFVLVAACLLFTFLRVIKRVPWLEKEKSRSDSEVMMHELMESSEHEIKELIASAKERVSQVDEDILEKRVKAVVLKLVQEARKPGA